MNPVISITQPHVVTAQPALVQPTMVQPALVQPAVVQPSPVQPFSVQPVGTKVTATEPQNQRDWSSEICDCFDDLKSCKHCEQLSFWVFGLD